ncbi:MAG: hypothetical protein KDK96_04755 [Chlamydiia bacterium]|nr:hypothetical protein [Chlamydiia bacterium]
MKNSIFSLKTWVALSLLIVCFLMNTALANHYLLYGTVGEGSGGTTTLVVIDQNTGGVEDTIGTIGYRINGLAYDPTTGNLYATTSANDPIAPNHLLTISTETGAGTIIAPLSLPVTAQTAVVLTCDSTGQLYAWSEWSSGTDDDLLRVDKNTGAVFEYPDAGLSTYTQSLDFNNSNTLYLLNGSTTIYTVSTTTGLPTSVGTSASPIAHHGKFHPITNQLWAIDEAYNTNPRDIVILDIPSGTIVNTLPTVDDLHTLAFAPLSHIDAETRLIRALGKKRLIYQKGLYP